MYRQPIPQIDPMTGKIDEAAWAAQQAQQGPQQMDSKFDPMAQQQGGTTPTSDASAEGLLKALTNPLGALLGGNGAMGAPSMQLIQALLGGGAIKSAANGDIAGAIQGLLPMLAGVDMGKFKRKGTKSSPGANGDTVDPQTGYSPMPAGYGPPMQGGGMQGPMPQDQGVNAGGNPNEMAMMRMQQSGMFS